MYDSVKNVHKKLIQISPETALIFHERMAAVLAHAPFITHENSEKGIFEIETVWEIHQQAKNVLRARGVDLGILGEL
jgi:hypothetical protein